MYEMIYAHRETLTVAFPHSSIELTSRGKKCKRGRIQIGPDLLTASEERGQETTTNLTDQVRLPTEKKITQKTCFKNVTFHQRVLEGTAPLTRPVPVPSREKTWG